MKYKSGTRRSIIINMANNAISWQESILDSYLGCTGFTDEIRHAKIVKSMIKLI